MGRKKKFLGAQKGMNPALAALTQKHEEDVLLGSASKVTLLLACMVLHDKFGYGNKRLNRFIDEYHEQLEAYNTGYVERVHDFEDVLWDECGIRIEDPRDKEKI